MESKEQQNDLLTAEQLLKETEIITTASMSMGEKLHSMFKRNDLVRIKNIDDKPSGYVFVNPDDEIVQMPNKATRRVIPGKPQAVVLQPDEIKVMYGWQAYIALDRLWKEYAQRRSTAEQSLIGDDVARDEFLNKSFLGLFDPNATEEVASETPKTVKAAKPVKAVAKKAADNGDELGFDE